MGFYTLIEKFEYAEESWGLWQEFVKFFRHNSEIFVGHPFYCLPQAFNEFLPQAWIKLAEKSQKVVFYIWKNMLFPTCSKFYSGLRQAGKKLSQKNCRDAARIWQTLATSLNFLQHNRIFLWVYIGIFLDRVRINFIRRNWVLRSEAKPRRQKNILINHIATHNFRRYQCRHLDSSDIVWSFENLSSTADRKWKGDGIP